MSEQSPQNNSEFLEQHPDAVLDIKMAYAMAKAGDESRNREAEFRQAGRELADAHENNISGNADEVDRYLENTRVQGSEDDTDVLNRRTNAASIAQRVLRQTDSVSGAHKNLVSNVKAEKELANREEERARKQFEEAEEMRREVDAV